MICSISRAQFTPTTADVMTHCGCLIRFLIGEYAVTVQRRDNALFPSGCESCEYWIARLSSHSRYGKPLALAVFQRSILDYDAGAGLAVAVIAALEDAACQR